MNRKVRDLKEYIRTTSKNKIASNFFYLSLLQAANSLLPFITLPYLVHTIGFDKVGVVFMAQALMSYLTIITDYGFNLTATKFISLNRINKSRMEYIHGAVISTKLMLICISFFILLALTFLFPVFSEERLLFLLSFTIVLGNTFFPVWFFQGIEEMKYISLMNFISKIFFTLSIFIFIRHQNDYIKVNFLLGTGSILSSIVAIIIISKKYAVRSFITTRYIRVQLNEGWHIFVSNLAVNIYMYSNVFILGLFASKTMLGYFGVADKCIQGLRQLLVVFYQVTYPKACHVAEKSHLLLIEFYRNVFIKFLIFISFCCTVIFIMSPWVVLMLTRSYQTEVTFMLRCMCLIPIIVGLNIPFNQSAVIYQIKKPYSLVLVLGSAINVIANIFLAKLFSAYGTIGAIYITESFITCGLFLILYRTKSGQYSLQSIFRFNSSPSHYSLQRNDLKK